MARVSLNQASFTSGELSPRVLGRTDIDRYGYGVKLSLNAHPVIQGGIKRRAGTLFVNGAVSDVEKASILIPFVQGASEAWMLEFGNLTVRIYDSAGANTGITLSSPYTSAQLLEIDWAQSDTTLWLFHPDVTPQRLEHLDTTTWVLSAAPFSTVPFDEVGYVGTAAGTLSAASVGTGRTLTTGVAMFLASDVGRGVICGPGLAVITAYTNTQSVTVQITRAFSSTTLPANGWTVDISPQTDCTPTDKDPVGKVTTLTLAAAGWRASDVGSMVRINGGLLKITNVSSATVASARILRVLSATVAAPALSWSLEPPVWASVYGYPRTGTIYQQRLITAGNKKFPRTVWGSRTGELLDFERWTDDSDSFAFTIDSDESTPIRYVTATQELAVLTQSAEYSMRGGVEKPITPSNVRVKPESNHGSALVRPQQVNREVMFVQRAGRKVRAFGYRYDFDGFSAPDITALAEHISKTGITSMAFAQEPEQMLWATRSDGRLLSCTIDRDQQPSVIAWAPHTSTGFVEWVATIPNGTQDQLWLLVRRTINGVTKRYIERQDISFQPWHPSIPDPEPVDDEEMDRPTYGCTVDCGIVVDNVAGQTVFSVPHLAGCEVDIVTDGAKQPRQTVAAGGSLTLTRSSKRTLIGLPFRTHIKLLTPELQGPEGTAQAQPMRTGQVSLKLLDSIGGKVRSLDGEEDELPARQFGAGILDQPPMPFTGLVDVTKLGWAKGKGELSIIQDDPMPLHILAVVRRQNMAGG